MTTNVARMNPTQARAWLALVRTTALVPQALDAQLTADAGLIQFEYGVLGMLRAAPGRTLRTRELADALHSPAPRLSKAVSRLEARDLVERITNPDDGRAINVHLTRKGARAWAQATGPHVALAKDTILGDFDDEQLTRLAELLTDVVRRLDPDGSFGVVDS